MRFKNASGEVFVPDNEVVEQALRRTTHLGIGAHQDDLEILAFHGIEACFDVPDRWFTGVTCTDGSGSPRSGVYADYTGMQMQELRKREQCQAAYVGRYGAMIQLDYASPSIKDSDRQDLAEDLQTILQIAQPDTVYLHNLADRHDTHVATAIAPLEALRTLPLETHPPQVWGVEIWGDLDWLAAGDKGILNVSGWDNLAAALLGVFDSQLAGGKRYDLAVLARGRAHATFLESHAVDTATQLCFALDLTPLIQANSFDPAAYVETCINNFKEEVVDRIRRYTR